MHSHNHHKQPLVHILMGVLNGADHLPTQLGALSRQDWTAWRLTCSDDGSMDGSRGCLRAFRDLGAQPVTLVRGPSQGFAANYLSMMRGLAHDTGHVALCDQDDLWFPAKLSRAMTMLGALNAQRPALYAAARLIWDARQGTIVPERSVVHRPSFQNALIENIAPGNTIVLNAAAARLARNAARLAGPVFAHDWWLYLLISGAGGTIVADPRPVLLYRQHAQNVIGAGHGIAGHLRRKMGVLNGDYRRRISTNIAAMRRCGMYLTEENRDILARFAAAQEGRSARRIYLMGACRPYRQSGLASAAFWGAAVIGRV